MQTMLVLLYTTLLTIYAAAAHAQDRNTRVVLPTEAANELVVLGVGRCGSWPIEHQGLEGCEFAELKKKEVPEVLELRRKFFSDCLSCKGNQCIIKAWPEDRISEQLFCKRVFWTPTRVSRFMNPGARSGPFRVSYTFKISTDGRVEDIELISFDSEIEEEQLMQLIADGAARTRFEPIVVDEVAYELVGLRDTIIRP